MLKSIILEVGEVLCPKCKGKGKFCNHCMGKGKLDWIQNIVGIRSSNSSMDNMNIRRLTKYIQDGIENIIEPYEIMDEVTIQKIKQDVENYLDFLKNEKSLYDYKIDVIKNSESTTFNMTLKPAKTTEFIQLTTKVTGGNF